MNNTAQTAPTPDEAPMKPKAYMLGFWLPPAAIIIAGLMIAQSGQNVSSGLMSWLGAGPLITFLVFTRKAWLALDPQPKRPRPNEAFLLLIPIFNIFWQYRVIYPLGRVLQEDANKYNLKELEIGDSFSRVFCHLCWVSWLWVIIVSFMIWSAPIHFSPFASSPSVVIVAVVILFWVLFLAPFALWLALANLILWHYSTVINIIVSHAKTTRHEMGAEPEAEPYR